MHSNEALKNKTENKNSLLRDISSVILILVCGAFILWRCRYGAANVDEAFYLATPYRILNGDGLFIDEWHLSQMSSVLLLPFMWIFRLITGSLEGIVLASRYLGTVITILVSVYAYFCLKKQSRFGALFASCVFCLYVPMGVNALSYMSLGHICVLMFCLLLYSNQNKNLKLIFAGVFLAFAVLCCPYLVIMYGCYLLFVIVYNVNKNHLARATEDNNYCVLKIRPFLFVTLGAGIVAIAFFAFVFSRMEFADFFSSIKACLYDPEHPPLSIIGKAKEYISTILRSNAFSILAHVAVALLFIVCLFDKNRRALKHKQFYLSLNLILVSVFLITLFYDKHFINFLMWPVNLLAPIILLLLNTKQAKRIFMLFWIPGIIYSICIHLASNQCFFVISSASSISLFASFMLVFLLYRECNNDANKDKIGNFILKLCILFLAITQITSMVNIRYHNVFWDKDISEQVISVNDGIYKGLVVSDKGKKLDDNARLYTDIVNSYDEKKVLFLSNLTMLYLYGDYENCGYSAWLSDVTDVTLERLDMYYQMNPKKYPEVVMVEVKNRYYAERFCEMFNYRIDYDKECLILVKA